MMREGDVTREPSKERRGWHLDKSVNLPFLLALTAASMGVFAYIMNQNARQAVTETKLLSQEMELRNVKDDFKINLTRIENNGIRMEGKLDRLIEARR